MIAHIPWRDLDDYVVYLRPRIFEVDGVLAVAGPGHYRDVAPEEGWLQQEAATRPPGMTGGFQEVRISPRCDETGRGCEKAPVVSYLHGYIQHVQEIWIEEGRAKELVAAVAQKGKPDVESRGCRHRGKE